MLFVVGLTSHFPDCLLWTFLTIVSVDFLYLCYLSVLNLEINGNCFITSKHTLTTEMPQTSKSFYHHWYI